MPTPCDKNRLLIVDDETSIVRLFKVILSSALPETSIDTAFNGREAVENFENGRHGTLLMDLHMPVMDGREAFETIQNLCREKDWVMPSVVFCTGFAPPDWVRTALHANTSHQLLNKPVTGTVLVETIRKSLA